MHFLLILLLAVSVGYSAESVILASASGSSLARTIINEQFEKQGSFASTLTRANTDSSRLLPESVQMLLAEPKKTPFVVEYGNGALMNQLEKVTLDLLEYKVISNLVTAFSDDFQLTPPDKRLRLMVNFNNREMKVSYSF